MRQSEQAWPPRDSILNQLHVPICHRGGLLYSAFCSRGISQLSNALFLVGDGVDSVNPQDGRMCLCKWLPTVVGFLSLTPLV